MSDYCRQCEDDMSRTIECMGDQPDHRSQGFCSDSCQEEFYRELSYIAASTLPVVSCDECSTCSDVP